MGVASFIKSLAKGLSWSQMAVLALEHGPEIYDKIMERFRSPVTEAAAAEEQELKERVARLEALLLEQEELIRREAEKGRLLEERCQSLEQRLSQLKVVAVLLAGASLVMLILLCR